MLSPLGKKKLTNDAKPRICIVGSGPGGGIAAFELAKSGKATVIVVDTDQITSLYSQVVEKKLEAVNLGHPFNQETTRGFGFGGSSNLWHGVLTTLDEEDWKFIDLAAGDKISDEIKSLYDELCYAFGELPREARSKFTSKSQGNDLYREIEGSGRFTGKNFFIQKRPFRVRDLLFHIKGDCADIVFVENATALYLSGSHDNPSHATALVVDVDGRKQTIEADYFILAAGALETPRIVMQGNEQGDFTIENSNIGKHLSDHPWMVVGEIIAKRGWFRLGLSDIYAARGLRYRIGYRLKDAVNNPQPGMNHCIAIKPLFFGDYALFKEAMKAIIVNKPSLRSLFGLLVRFRIRDILASLFLLACEKFGLGVVVRKALVFCYLEQPSRSESAVSLIDRYDSCGRRIPAINWVVGDEEAAGVALVKNTLSIALSGSDRFLFCPYDNPAASLASGAHHAGTMRIGQNPLNGVVDKDLKMFGAQNVFVCDLSVFPNYGNSNPTLTLAAFSLRLARHMLGLFDK